MSRSHEIVSAHDVKLGMFVAELDRPWLDSPFLLQGFLVETPEQVVKLRELCNFVAIDRSRSVGLEYAAPPVVDVRRPVSRLATLVGGHSDEAGAGTRGRSRPAAPTQAADHARRRQDWLETERREDSEFWRDVVGRHRRAGHVATGIGAVETVVPEHSYPRPLTRHSTVAEAAPNRSLRPMNWVQELSRDVVGGRRFVMRSRAARPESRLEAIVSAPSRGEKLFFGTPYEDKAVVEEEIVQAKPVFEQAQTVVRDIADELDKGRAPQIDRIRDAVQGMAESVIRNPDALMWLTKLKHTDNVTYDHSLNVAVHLLSLGRHLGLSREQLNTLGMAGLLQDLGKIKLPAQLLRKRGELTPDEQHQIHHHVAFSLEILAGQPDVSTAVREIVAKHHERIDGSGYPRGLKGDRIGLMAELAGLVDSYCAISSQRAYRAALDHHRALKAVYAMGGKLFSEAVVATFIQCVSLYPIGTLVELSTGEVGVVVEQNRIRKLKPRVLILLRADKSALPEPRVLDLMTDPMVNDDEPYRIVRALQPGAHGIDPREFYL
jgi:HD-GYP domain-containing protein (c-di-GMP phosphodiesterase class II)